MSFFKNISKVVSQNTLNSGNRTYILKNKASIQNPALFYLNTQAPPRDLFQLSLAAYHLTRKHQATHGLLNQLESETQSENSILNGARERLYVESGEGRKLAILYADEMRSLLRTGAGNIPINNAIQALYVFEALDRSDVNLYEEFLFPIIREKLQYASLSNLLELTSILSNLKYYEDRELWGAVVRAIEEKFERPGPKYVRYSGWTLNTYEYDEKATGNLFETESERYLNDLRRGNKFTADLRREFRSVYDRIRSSFLLRWFAREGRITSTLDNFTEGLDREKLRKALENARRAGVNVDSVLGRLRTGKE